MQNERDQWKTRVISALFCLFFLWYGTAPRAALWCSLFSVMPTQAVAADGAGEQIVYRSFFWDLLSS